MEPLKIKISSDYSHTPGPRYEDEGKFSGEVFRKNVLLPKVQEAIQAGNKLIVDLDNTAGYGTSFLEESFGGLIRNNKIDYNALKKLLIIKSEEEQYLIDDIFEYMKEADEEIKKGTG